jgi:hypothetical protein
VAIGSVVRHYKLTKGADGGSGLFEIERIFGRRNPLGKGALLKFVARCGYVVQEDFSKIIPL